jgi:hypothetical protein
VERPKGPAGLPELSLYPNHEPIFRPVTLRFALSPEHHNNRQLGVYFYLPRSGRYRLVDSRVEGGMLYGEVTHFDTFYVLADTLAPEVTNPRIFQRRDRKWELTVSVKDDLSGIDYSTVHFYWNDVRGIAEYDPGWLGVVRDMS